MNEVVQRLRHGRLAEFQSRKRMLESLRKGLRAFTPRLQEALKADLGKSAHEAYASEIGIVEHEVELALRNLQRWMRPRRVRTPLYLWPGRSEIHTEPLGVVLIIGPWNYPLQLSLSPLVGALAAGNTAVVKPSELAANTSRVIKEMIAAVLPPDVVAVVEGGVGPTTELLGQRFDHIFFTGSGRVGQIVYQAAARHLTPVTLELGGKSPVFVLSDADLDLAARRITWGKFLNAGQTCVAPDYVFADEAIAPQLVEKIKNEIQHHFGPDPKASADYGRIINAANFDRLHKMIDPRKLYCGGRGERETLYLEPTVQRGDWTDAAMSEEIFGPVLPVLTFRGFDQALEEVAGRDKPLAAYFFSASMEAQEQFLKKLSFGGGCINDVVVHLANSRLPFGGVGPSGLGQYHGHSSYLCFSHSKSVVRKSRWFDLDLRYPPYTARKTARLRSLFKWSRFWS